MNISTPVALNLVFIAQADFLTPLLTFLRPTCSARRLDQGRILRDKERGKGEGGGGVGYNLQLLIGQKLDIKT